MRDILNNIYLYQDYILSVLFMTIIFYIVFIISIKNFKLNSKKVKIYGIFLELKTRAIILLVQSILIYIFILYLIFNPSNDNYILTLIILSLYSLFYIIFNFNFKTILREVNSVIFSFIGVVSCNVLYGYIFDIKFEYLSFIIYILIFIFVFLYATYNLFRRIYDIMYIDKYIRKVRGRWKEDILTL